MKAGDYSQCLALWKRSKGIGLWGDTRKNLVRYLKRNPGVSQVAVAGSKVVGTILGGHDGRRGFIFHLAVEKSFRRLGLGRQLVALCLQKLEKAGVLRTHLLVFKNNPEGRRFWKRMGWMERSDLQLFSSPLQKTGKSKA